MTQNEIEGMLADARIGRLAMASRDGRPYVIPLPFYWMSSGTRFQVSGFKSTTTKPGTWNLEPGTVYVRLAMTGRKGQVLSENDHVCFEVDEYTDDLSDYASVLVEGRLRPVSCLEEKARVKALNDAKYRRLRKGYRPGHQRTTPLANLPLVKIEVETICGRKKNSQNLEPDSQSKEKNTPSRR